MRWVGGGITIGMQIAIEFCLWVNRIFSWWIYFPLLFKVKRNGCFERPSVHCSNGDFFYKTLMIRRMYISSFKHCRKFLAQDKAMKLTQGSLSVSVVTDFLMKIKREVKLLEKAQFLEKRSEKRILLSAQGFQQRRDFPRWTSWLPG